MAAVQQNMILIINIMQPQSPFCVSVNTSAVNADKFHVCRHLQFQHGLLYSACKHSDSADDTVHHVSLQVTVVRDNLPS